MKCDCDVKTLMLEDFNNFSGNYEDSKETIALKIRVLESAKAIVEQYLGYSLDQRNYEEDHIGSGIRELYLYNRPIQEVYNVYINDVPVDPLNYSVEGDRIRLNRRSERFPNNSHIVVEYCAGYGLRVPEIIKQTILRIATLMLMEGGENIGITSKSFADNSRTFINYTNYSKYLDPIKELRTFSI